MKHIIKTAIIASSLVMGATFATAAPEGFGIQYPEKTAESNIQSTATDLTTQSVVDDNSATVGEIKGESDTFFDPAS